MKRIAYEKLVSYCVCVAASLAVMTGFAQNLSAQKTDDETKKMTVIVLYRPSSCVDEIDVEHIFAETEDLPVSYQSFPYAQREIHTDDEKWLRGWLRKNDADGVIWFSCEQSSIHLYASTDQWIREDRALNPETPGISEEAILAVVEYWMLAIVPKWQKAQKEAEQDVFANLSAPDQTTKNERNDHSGRPEKANVAAETSGDAAATDDRLTIRGGRINLEADAVGTWVQPNSFLPGAQGCVGGKITPRVELYLKGGILKSRDVASEVDGFVVDATIKTAMFGLGVRLLRQVKTGTVDFTLMLEGAVMPYDTVVLNGETRSSRVFQSSVTPMVGMTMALFPHGYLTIRGGAQLLVIRPKFFTQTADGNVLLYSPSAVAPIIMAGIGFEIF